MKKRLNLKILVWIFVIFTLLCTITGCEKREFKKVEKIETKGAWSVEQVSLTNKDFSLSYDNFISNVTAAIYADNCLYYVIHPDDAAVEIQGIRLDSPNEPVTYVSFPYKEQEATNISYLQYNQDGSLTYLKEVSPSFEFDYLTQSEEEILESSKKQLESVVTLEIFSIKKNSITSSLDVSDVLSGFSVMSCVSNNKEELYLRGFYTNISDSGDVTFEERIIILNMKSGKAEKIKSWNNYSGMVASGNGEVCDIISSGNTVAFQLWDKEEKEFSSKNKVVCDKSAEYGFLGCYTGAGDTIFYLDKDVLYQCDVKNKETEFLLKLPDWDITGADILLVAAVDKDTMYIFSQKNNYGSRGFDINFFSLTAVDSSELPKKTELVLTCSSVDDSIRQLAADFNRANKEYKVKIEEVSEGPKAVFIDDLESGLTKDVFYDTVAAGKAGDLILFRNNNMWEFEDKEELFENLYPYIEADAELSKHSLNRNVLRFCEMNEKLIAIPGLYYPKILACNKNVLGESPLTMDRFLEIINENPDKKILYNISKEEILQKLFNYNMNYFIDFEKKTCCFTDGAFEKFLLAADSFMSDEEIQQEREASGYLSNVFRIRQGQQIFYMNECFISEDYQVLKALFGENCEITGYPGIDGTQIPAVINSLLFAVNKDSNNKEGCFEFIKYYVFEHCLKPENSFSFSIDNDRLREQISEDVKNTKEKEEEIDDGIILELPALAEQDEEKIFELAKSVNVLSLEDFYFSEISEIFREETQEFFNGRKTAEKLCETLDMKIEEALQKNQY